MVVCVLKCAIHWRRGKDTISGEIVNKFLLFLCDLFFAIMIKKRLTGCAENHLTDFYAAAGRSDKKITFLLLFASYRLASQVYSVRVFYRVDVSTTRQS